jgi:GNAT superfamily N-acetyltransferase
MSVSVEPSEPFATGVVVRQATAQDAESLARIFYDAFESIAIRHNLPIEPPSREFAAYKVSEMIGSSGFAGLVAEGERGVLGSAFIDERAVIAGIGPVTVDPDVQDEGIGRTLMEAALRRVRERRTVGARLVQTAYHYRSLALYAKLGFVVREPLSVLQGDPPKTSSPGRGVRPACEDDLVACTELCLRVHGHDRSAELHEAIRAKTARVVERPDGICGYATGFGYGWHAVAETNEDLIALLASADAYLGLGILVPSRNDELLRWCLGNGLRLVQQSTLMTIGLYNDPLGAYLPSILF